MSVLGAAAEPDFGWWMEPKWWIVMAIVMVVVILAGIYLKALSEHQGFDLKK
jgi:hypothetical protein